MAQYSLDQNLLPFVGNMVLPWENIQIITHKEMDLQNPQRRHSFKSLKG